MLTDMGSHSELSSGDPLGGESCLSPVFTQISPKVTWFRSLTVTRYPVSPSGGGFKSVFVEGPNPALQMCFAQLWKSLQETLLAGICIFYL